MQLGEFDELPELDGKWVNDEGRIILDIANNGESISFVWNGEEYRCTDSFYNDDHRILMCDFDRKVEHDISLKQAHKSLTMVIDEQEYPMSKVIMLLEP